MGNRNHCCKGIKEDAVVWTGIWGEEKLEALEFAVGSVNNLFCLTLAMKYPNNTQALVVAEILSLGETTEMALSFWQWLFSLIIAK